VVGLTGEESADDWPDWMLHYAAVRTLKLRAREAIEEHYTDRMVETPTEFSTAWKAAKVAVLDQLARWGDE